MVFENDIEAKRSLRSNALHGLSLVAIGVGVVGLFVGLHTVGAGLVVGGAVGHLILGAVLFGLQRHRRPR